MGKHLGSTAAIYTVDRAHLTFLESAGVRPKFENLGYCEGDVKEFRDELDERLQERVPMEISYAMVDPVHPLRWVGRTKLALNVQPTTELIAVRGTIEQFLEERLGELPQLRPFSPHVSIGQLQRRVAYREYKDPTRLVPSWADMPGEIALNGAEVFLNHIHGDD